VLKAVTFRVGGKIGIFHEVLSFMLVVIDQTTIRKISKDFYLPQDASWEIFKIKC